MSLSDHKFSRLLRLNSESANVGLSDIANGKYVFNTNDSDLGQIRHVALKSAIIPNSEYNIHSSNNIFNWDDGVARTVTLPVGQYEISDLLTDLNTAVQVLTPTLVITQVALTQKLNFASVVPITLQSKTTDPMNTMAQVLGITEDSPVGFVSFDADSLPDLNGLRHVYVVSSALSNQTQLLTGNSGQQKFPIFADIPITAAFGKNQVDNTNNENTLDYSDFHSLKNISEIDVILVDESGRTLELNGLPWILMIRVYG